jgi:hypothetical protein
MVVLLRALISRRALRFAKAVTIALVLSQTLACFPQKGELRVVSQASPNPLVGVKRYAMASVTWDGFTYEGQPEATWLATRTPEQQASFANDKVVITQKLLDHLVANQEDDESFALASDDEMFTLKYNVSAYADGKFHWTLEVVSPGGAVVDAVEGPPSGYGFGFAPQFNFFVVIAAQHTVEYLRSRYGS